ncbi:exopolysaccharide transport family protein [Pedobacter sp. PWIIR3]
MDEIKKFLSLIKRYMLALIIVPIVTVIITYFLVRNQPNSYISESQIATGIVDETKQYQQISILNETMLQGQQITQEFSNLMSMMRMKKLLDQVSYKLILHDLTSKDKFRKESKLLSTLNSDARKHAVETYTELFAKGQGLDLSNSDQNGLNSVLQSMGYDSESLNSKLNIFRAGDSDFISIQFESESPNLCAFVVNELSIEFVKYYSNVVKTNKVKATNFLGVLLKEKTDTLASRMSNLRTYKIRNRVLNLDEQSKQLYSSIVEYENQKQQIIQNTSSYAGALNEIDRKFSPGERKYIESILSKVNQDIIDSREELSALYEAQFNNDFDSKYQVSIDSVRQKMSSEIAKSSDQYLTSPLATKQTLVQQKLDLEIKLDLSRFSVNALENKLRELNAKFDAMVPKEAEVQTLQMGIEIATKEYMDVLDKYNQSSLESGISVKLNIIQVGMPGAAQPSKKMLLVILSAIISLIFCMVIIFVFFLFDRSIISPEQLANKTALPVLGTINELNISSIDLKEIWTSNNLEPVVMDLKNQLRSIRYEIENDLQGKILVINSLNSGQGKTFLAMSLAFAWMMTNKKILVIDGNFNNPKISDLSSANYYIEDYLQGKINLDYISNESITILKNRGGDKSLIELADYKQIKNQLELAKEKFDLILIETAPLNVVNQSKEWLSFADNIIGVFKYGNSLSDKKRAQINYLSKTGMYLGWIMNQVPQKK